MTLYPELDKLSLQALSERFLASPPPTEEDGTLYFQEVACRIASQGDAGIKSLSGAWPWADEPRLRALIAALTRVNRDVPGLGQTLRVLLADTRPLLVMEAIDGLTRLDDTEALAQISGLQGHASPYVRGAVLRYLRRITPDHALPALLAALADPAFVVRESAADELGELGDPQALPALHALLGDPHPDVRLAVETAVAILETTSSG